MTRPLVLIAALLASACATFSPSRAADSILPMQSDAGGYCTVWAVTPNRWVTAKHCFAEDPGPWRIVGVIAHVIAVDPEADIAIVTGPWGSPLAIAAEPPARGEMVTTWGYGLSTKTLLVFKAVVISPDADYFTGASHEFIVGGANGMPGMSGGPMLYKGRVVSVITGGGPAPSHAHLVGSGVSYNALVAFVKRHVQSR
jgi:hypothetical protein